MKKLMVVLLSILALFITLSVSASANADSPTGEEAIHSAVSAFLDNSGDNYFTVADSVELTVDLTLPDNFILHVEAPLTVGENCTLTVQDNALFQVFSDLIVNGTVNNYGFTNMHGGNAHIIINGRFSSLGSHGHIRMYGYEVTPAQVTGNLEGVLFSKYLVINDDDSLTSALSYYAICGNQYQNFNIEINSEEATYLNEPHTIPAGVRFFLYHGDLVVTDDLIVDGVLQITQNGGYMIVTGSLTVNGSVQGPGILIIEKGSSFTDNGNTSAPVAYHDIAGAHGTIGRSVFWELDPEGSLRISGSGYCYAFKRTRTLPWFDRLDSIRRVTITDGVKDIPAFAFWDCRNLSEVSISSTVEQIYMASFANCTGLQRVVFPISLQSVGQEAFAGCSGLKEVRFLGNAPERFYPDCFYAVNAVVFYPPGAEWSSDVMLDYGGNLTWTPFGPDLTIPAEVTVIEAETFRGCAAFYVELSENVSEIRSQAFAECPNLRHIRIPSAMVTIAPDAFQNVTGLTIHAPSGGTAQQFAMDNGYLFVAE